MLGVLNKFFYKLPQKIWRFWKKIIGLLFFRFDNCRPFEGGTGKCLQWLPSEYEPAGILRFFVIKCRLAAETFAFIHWQTL